MIRIVIENILLFLLPAAAYFAYVYLRASDNQGAGVNKGQIIDDAPLVWLLLAGALMVLAVTFTFADMKGGSPDQVYYPPTMKDGKLVPGHFK